MVSWKNSSEKAIDDFRNKGYNFKHIEEMNITTIANKMDMSYDFYDKHILHAVTMEIKSYD